MKSIRLSKSLAAALVLSVAPVRGLPSVQDDGASPFRLALQSAERSLDSGDLEGARARIERALERDRKAIDAWELRARWAEAAEDPDELVYCLHQVYRLSIAQKRKKAETAAVLERLSTLDPIASDLVGMKERFVAKLFPIAERYEKEKRPHSAIRVLKEILALDPEREEAQLAIERIAATPDPSLAGEAKPKDLFADVSEEWIAEFDAEHGEWDEAAEEERENYITVTDSGYEVLIRTAEAMEQMNAFYRVFFEYGTEEHGGSVPRIKVHVFKNRDEYLTLGIGPPVEWSGGHFTGSHVETYISSGFEAMTGTLFHEAAHQFVSLATSATGWLNEGLASFFEGTRILPNGTVIMNMPANHRLFPLADRMRNGWMASHDDGTDASDPNATPTTAPTFRIVLENEYGWGPPWYAPTWGVVYFLYNYQDPFDGRFVYRKAFGEFINSSGGRVGKGAVRNFEEVVLANPAGPYKGLERPEDAPELLLPKTVDELDAVWKKWMLDLQQEQRGELEVVRAYHQWGQFAAAAKEYTTAKEHFEKGLVAQPDDITLLMEFADLLSEHFDDPDRAAKLVREGIHFMELQPEPDVKKIEAAERLLAKLDPKANTLAKVHDEIAATARSIVQRYGAAGRPLMVMDVSYRMARNLGLDDLYESYADAVRQSGRSLSIWKLAYNESNLDGWSPGSQVFGPDGSLLAGSFGAFDVDRYDYQFLTLDEITSGDFSMEAEILAEKGKVNFTGFVFGRKSDSGFHGMLYFPEREVEDGAVPQGWVDLMSSFGPNNLKTWRHVPVDARGPAGRTSAGVWHKLRLDVIGRNADMWFDGELIATHEFPSLEVLRGSFGLLMGPGDAKFKNVRYLARDSADPAGAIERGIRMERLETESGGAVGGSFQGKVPPFPSVERWVQGERSSWAEAGPVPQLLVLWSIDQNELVRIDEWLMDLAQKSEAYGMQFLCICSPNDAPKIEAYLKEHALPGAVGIDLRPEGTFGIGDTNEAFFIRRFNLPRLLLLDLDQTVAWEGDPGFEINTRPEPPFATFLDDPLSELVAKRGLRGYPSWRKRWEENAQPALAEGQLSHALEVLRAAEAFDPKYMKEAGRAQAILASVEAALGDLVGSGESFHGRGTDPALVELIAWAPLFEIEVTKKDRKGLKKYLSSAASKGWDNTLKQVAKFQKKKGEPAEKAGPFLELLARFDGTFAEALREELTAARDAGDWEMFAELVDGASKRPVQWLARSYFGW
ncbi:MAG: hypothetical protein GY711_06195 [bacterium]|nr:hypothetical protein [bacterium]